MLTLGTEKIAGTRKGLSELYMFAMPIWMGSYARYYPTSEVLEFFDAFLGREVVAKEMAMGYDYFYLKANDKRAGILAVKPHEGRLYFGKLYVANEYQGKGISKFAMTVTEELARERALKSIYLHTARLNDQAIKVYEKLGFQVVPKILNPKGELLGDQLTMEKVVHQKPVCQK